MLHLTIKFSIMLIDKEWNKTEFAKEVGIRTNTMEKLSRNKFMSM